MKKQKHFISKRRMPHWLPLYTVTKDEAGAWCGWKGFELLFSAGFQIASIILFWVGYGFLIGKEEDGGYGNGHPTINWAGGLTGGFLTVAYVLVALISVCGGANNRGLSVLVMPVYALILGCLFSALAGTTALFALTFKYQESVMSESMPKHTLLALSAICQSMALSAFLACSAALIARSDFQPEKITIDASAADQTVPLNPNVRINLATRRIGV